MHRDQYVRLQFFDLGDHLLEVVGGRGPEMEAADDRVHLADARDLLRLPHRVDDADVPARRDDDEPLPRMLKQVACSCTCSSGTIFPCSSAAV